MKTLYFRERKGKELINISINICLLKIVLNNKFFRKIPFPQALLFFPTTHPNEKWSKKTHSSLKKGQYTRFPSSIIPTIEMFRASPRFVVPFSAIAAGYISVSGNSESLIVN